MVVSPSVSVVLSCRERKAVAQDTNAAARALARSYHANLSRIDGTRWGGLKRLRVQGLGEVAYFTSERRGRGANEARRRISWTRC